MTTNQTGQKAINASHSAESLLTSAVNLLDDAMEALRAAEQSAGEMGAEHEADEILRQADKVMALRDATDKILSAWTASRCDGAGW